MPRERIKVFNVRLPVSLWKFIKTLSMEEETSINKIMLAHVHTLYRKHKRKQKKLLTENNTMVS